MARPPIVFAQFDTKAQGSTSEQQLHTNTHHQCHNVGPLGATPAAQVLKKFPPSTKKGKKKRALVLVGVRPPNCPSHSDRNRRGTPPGFALHTAGNIKSAARSLCQPPLRRRGCSANGRHGAIGRKELLSALGRAPPISVKRCGKHTDE